MNELLLDDPLLKSAESYWEYFLARNSTLHLDSAVIDAVLKPACQSAFIAGWISCDCSASTPLGPNPLMANRQKLKSA